MASDLDELLVLARSVRAMLCEQSQHEEARMLYVEVATPSPCTKCPTCPGQDSCRCECHGYVQFAPGPFTYNFGDVQEIPVLGVLRLDLN